MKIEMKQFTYLIIIISVIATIIIGIISMGNQFSAGALSFIFLAVSPYAYLAIMTKLVSEKTPIIIVLVLSILVGVFGIWAFIDSLFIQTDAQSGMAFVVVPVYQWGFLLIASFPVYFLNNNKTL